MTDLQCDVAIIGAGSAGMSAYREVRKYTDRVLLIDGGPFGTTCARVGCMPSKLLIAPAEAVHAAGRLETFGARTGPVEIDGEAVMSRVRAERDRFVGFVLEAVDGFDQRHVVREAARFEDDHTLLLDGGRRVAADRVVIATGSRPHVPAVFDPVRERTIVNDDVFDWTDLPKSVAVFGGGVIGLELGQALARLGVRVRLISIGGAVGPISDPVLTAYASGVFRTEFNCCFDARDIVLEPVDGGARVSYVDPETGPVTDEFEWILAATGRRANVDGIGLDKTSVALDERGAPIVDAQTMQTSAGHIFVAGDATNDVPLLHEAADEGRIAGENAVRYPDVFKRRRRTPLGIVFSDPQIAIAGRSFVSLEKAGVDFAVGEVSFEDQGRARVMLKNKGHLRVYGEEGTGCLLGAEIFGPDAEHLAHLLAWTIGARLSVEDALNQPFYHPVVEEGLRSALRDLHAKLGMGPPPPLNCIDCGPGA